MSQDGIQVDRVNSIIFQPYSSNYHGFLRRGFCLARMQLRIAYMPPLYRPKKVLQLGHLWVTVLRDSMQQGIQAHGHNPTTHRTPARIHAIGPGSESVLVLIWLWQCGHTMVTGLGPKFGGLTTTTTCWVPGGAAGTVPDGMYVPAGATPAGTYGCAGGTPLFPSIGMGGGAANPPAAPGGADPMDWS